ncbi:MAG TPA: DoxX family membrane protein [Patescibacteria group bacterium]|nr:DoxX family membrane protein [Patescibacteria group bacterium]
MLAKSSLPKDTGQKFASLFLRVGLSVVFAYAAIDSLIHPSDWIGYLPHLPINIIDSDKLLKAVSVYQLVLVLWLLSGKLTRYAALLSALTLAGIIFSNLSLLAISFRDVGLLFAALALAFLG